MSDHNDEHEWPFWTALVVAACAFVLLVRADILSPARISCIEQLAIGQHRLQNGTVMQCVYDKNA